MPYSRYQGAIVREHRLLLLQQVRHSTGERYWVVPGGRRECDETEEQCVAREMWEETGLRVEVGRLLLDEEVSWHAIDRRKTYLCTAPHGEPAPGYEPESEYAGDFAFTAVQWLDLRTPHAWPHDVVAEARILRLLLDIREQLGCR